MPNRCTLLRLSEAAEGASLPITLTPHVTTLAWVNPISQALRKQGHISIPRRSLLDNLLWYQSVLPMDFSSEWFGLVSSIPAALVRHPLAKSP